MSLLLRLRRLDASLANPTELRRCLHLHDLLLFGVASVVGAGIFVTVGVAGKEAGPGLILAFFWAGVCCTPTALCYAELATRYPFAGSIYSFVSRTLGDYFAFIIGLSLIMDGVVSSAAVAKACAAYFAQVLISAGIPVPEVFTNLKINAVFSISLSAPIVLFGMGYTAYKGVKTMSRFNNILTGANIAIVAVVVVAGFGLIRPGNYDPPLPTGLAGVGRATALTFFAMLGFDAATSLAEETVDPERVMPRAILWTVAITTAMYMCISVVFCGLVPHNEIDDAAPLAHAFRARGAPILATIIAVGAVGNTATTLLGGLARLPRFMLRMASDGHLPKKLGEVDPTTEAPTTALTVSLAVAMVMSCVISFQALVQTASVGGLVGFSMVNSSVLLCRLRPAPANFAAQGPRRLPQDDRPRSPQAQAIGAADSPTFGAPEGEEEDDFEDDCHNDGPVADGFAAGPAAAVDDDVLDSTSVWEEPSGNVVRLAGLLFMYFLATMAFEFAFVLGAPPLLTLPLAFVAALLAGLSARCFTEAQRRIEADSEEGKRVFQTPLLPWLPIAAIAGNNFVIANLPALAMLRFILCELCIGSTCYVIRLRVRNLSALRRLRAAAARRLPKGRRRKRRQQRGGGGLQGVTLGSRAYANFDLDDDDADACNAGAADFAATPPAMSPPPPAVELDLPVRRAALDDDGDALCAAAPPVFTGGGGASPRPDATEAATPGAHAHAATGPRPDADVATTG